MAVTLTGTETEVGTESGTEVVTGQVSVAETVSCHVQAVVRVSAIQPAPVTLMLVATVTGRALLHGTAQQQVVVLLVQPPLQLLAY